jgi:hypothetical protein
MNRRVRSYRTPFDTNQRRLKKCTSRFIHEIRRDRTLPLHLMRFSTRRFAQRDDADFMFVQQACVAPSNDFRRVGSPLPTKLLRIRNVVVGTGCPPYQASVKAASMRSLSLYSLSIFFLPIWKSNPVKPRDKFIFAKRSITWVVQRNASPSNRRFAVLAI